MDGWGRTEVVPPTNQPVFLSLTTIPKFVIAPNAWPLLWQKEATFEPAKLASTPGVPRTLEVRFRNTTASAVVGRLRIRPPVGFRISPTHFSFELKPGELFRQQAEVATSGGAAGGLHRFEWEFELEQPRSYRWAILREVELAWPGLEIIAYLRRKGLAAAVHVDVRNQTSEELRLVFEVFSPQQPRTTLPPRIIGPGDHQLEILCELPSSGETSPLVLQVKEVDGPRRIRVPVNMAEVPSDKRASVDSAESRPNSGQSGHRVGGVAPAR